MSVFSGLEFEIFSERIVFVGRRRLGAHRAAETLARTLPGPDRFRRRRQERLVEDLDLVLLPVLVRKRDDRTSVFRDRSVRRRGDGGDCVAVFKARSRHVLAGKFRRQGTDRPLRVTRRLGPVLETVFVLFKVGHGDLVR